MALINGREGKKLTRAEFSDEFFMLNSNSEIKSTVMLCGHKVAALEPGLPIRFLNNNNLVEMEVLGLEYNSYFDKTIGGWVDYQLP